MTAGTTTRRVRTLASTTLALLGACNDGPGIAPTVEPPRITATAVVDEGGPIFRSLSVDLEEPAVVLVDYVTDGGPALTLLGNEPTARHELVLPRLRANRDYRYWVWSIAADGSLSEPDSGGFTTAPLPPELAAIEFTVSGTPSSPLVMLEAWADGLPYFPFVVDGEGNIVWYRTSERGSSGFTRLEDGTMAFNAAGGLWLVNLTNVVVGRLDKAEAAARTGIDPFTIHHDVIRTPDNTLLMLVQDTALVRDTVWTGEAIWEWDPATDVLEKRWTSKDFLDPGTDRGARTVPADWLHANSLHLGPRGNVVLSLFWLHEVLSIAPDYGSIEWRLGGPASSFAVENDAMEAGQHTAAEIARDRVLMFDNGRERTSGLYSRALEMELDREAGTARVAWEFRPSPDVYAPIVSSARRLANGNTLVGFGTPEGFEGATGPVSVFEVTPAGGVVWKLEVVAGFNFMYRATALGTLGGEVEAVAAQRH